MQNNKRNNNKRNVNNSKRSRRRAVNNTSSNSPPEINNRPIHNRCVRYSGVLTTSTPTTWNSQDIRCFVGATISGSTGYYPIADSVQLVRVGVTLLPNSTTSAGSVSFGWIGNNAPTNRETMMVANAIPIHRSFYPYEGTNASWWWTSTSTTTDLFSLVSALPDDIQIVLDVEIRYTFGSGSVTNVALTTTAGVSGLVYRLMPIGELIFTPVDLDFDS